MKSTSSISVFSKNLQLLSINDMAYAVGKRGFDGINLTVRPNVDFAKYFNYLKGISFNGPVN